MNGESVILGGLIKNKSNVITSEVPFFSSIPLIGNLFKNKQNTNDKINLVIIVTPYIIPKSKDLTYMRQQLSELKELEEQFSKKLNKNLDEIEKKEIFTSSKSTNNELHEKRIKEILGE